MSDDLKNYLNYIINFNFNIINDRINKGVTYYYTIDLINDIKEIDIEIQNTLKRHHIYNINIAMNRELYVDFTKIKKTYNKLCNKTLENYLNNLKI